MKQYLRTLLYIAVLALALPSPAHAHLIGGNGLMSGITHPVFGIDHLLAMVAVGIISVRIGGRAIWLVPATFVSFMIFGGLLGMSGLHIPAIETWIALSVLFFGVLIALSQKLPMGWAMLFVALFAICHGHAHGTEMPLIASPFLYAIGFMASTTLLHISGVLMGHYATKTKATSDLLRYGGVAMGLIGALLLIGAL